ncbi:hypothetical protein L596_014832 [Steinernema carpocapsae]|uniref:Uncharacterized protein n=1 Tax=Steinernema carpocapsae TaxID=34508 RepID=A0A4U5NE10_STECR|nr:hypothetical protein L596_014832 [Steinernema carpocapsae]
MCQRRFRVLCFQKVHFAQKGRRLPQTPFVAGVSSRRVNLPTASIFVVPPPSFVLKPTRNADSQAELASVDMNHFAEITGSNCSPA